MAGKSAAQIAAAKRNLEKARAAKKKASSAAYKVTAKGLPSMGTAKAAKKKAFKRKPKGSSAQNSGSRAANRKRVRV